MRHRPLRASPRRRALVLCLAAAFGSASIDLCAHVAPRRAIELVPEWLERNEEPSGTIIVVENCNDSGAGSLREAIGEASGDTVIDLDSLSCSTITLATGALVVNQAGTPTMTLRRRAAYSDGRRVPSLTIDAGNDSRVLVNEGLGSLYVEGLALRNGSSDSGKGGCVYANGPLFLDAVTVANCYVVATGSDAALGGAIYAKNELNLDFSTISGSEAHATSGYTYGGGIFSAYLFGAFYSAIDGNVADGIGYGGGIAARGRVQIELSLVAGNHAQYDGGLALFGGSTLAHGLLIAGSTIATNVATGNVGGIEADDKLYLYNDTIAFNSGGAGRASGVVLNGASVLSMYSTIVADNAAAGVASDISGSGTIRGSNDLVIASSTPLPGGTIAADPLLGDLESHGGQTPVMALLPGSPAIDAGNNVLNLVCDQRAGNFSYYFGFNSKYPRIVGANADIGAYETGADDEIFHNAFDGPPLLPVHCLAR